MTFRGQLSTSQGQLRISLTPAVTPTTPSSVFWEQSPMSEATFRGEKKNKGEMDDDAEEEAAIWKHLRRLTDMGVPPTLTPCPSPVSFHLPSIPPPPPPSSKPTRQSRSRTKASSNILRDLDPKVRFYVSASNASDHVTAGKSFSRAATPVWNRAPLGRCSSSSSSGNCNGTPQEGASSGLARTDRQGRGGGGRGGGEDVKLNLEVMRLNRTASARQVQPDPAPVEQSSNQLQDTVPSVAVTISPQCHHHHHHNNDGDLHHSNRSSLVSQDSDFGQRPRGRSANYGSARRRLPLPAGDFTATTTTNNTCEIEDCREDFQPVHPFLRMYQTRPGAFARLLSRENDLKAVRVAPGSTIASLMVPHPMLAGGERADGEEEEEEGGEEFDECVQGKTIDMKRKKRRKKQRPRYTLPSLRLFTMDWPRRQQRRLRRRKTPSSPQKDNEDEDSNESTSKPTVPKAGLYMLSEFPKQFVLSSHEEDAIINLDRSLSDTDADWLQEAPRDPAELRRLARELESFEDMDYMLPGHLDELLRQEGVADQVVDSTVALERVWHDRALYLNHIYHIRRRKFLARPSRYSSLPPIHRNPLPKDPPPPDPSLPPPSHDVEARRERRENRSRPWDIQDVPVVVTPEKPVLKPLVTRTAEVKVKRNDDDVQEKTRRELELYRTEVDRVRWEADRVQEITSLPSEFVQPKLVFISSKVPRCHSMSKAIRRGDNSILYNVYDFDKCTFADLLNTTQAQLEAYMSGCKAKSIMFMCQGAEGCLYMFHKIVLTPQKMKRVQYQQIKEFWKGLGELLTKVDHEETTVHLLGGQLHNAQGKALLYEIQKAMLPNLVRVDWVQEETDGGREAVEQYFDYRKFILWRAKHDSSNSLDYTDITRSWSSLADEAEDMDHR